MSDNFIPGLQQAANCLISRRRELPIRGDTLVSIGQEILADQIVARAELPGDVHILRIAESLGIESKDVAAQLKVKVGDRVLDKQVLCDHKGLFGLFSSQFKSPSSGSVDFISEALGHIGLRMPPQVLEVNAYCGGKVTGLQEGFSVDLQTEATLVQGIFGVGGERQGIIKVLDLDAGQYLRVEHLPPNFEGNIVVGGTKPDIEVLNYLSEGGAAGLVVGGIDDVALQQFLGFDIGLAVTGNENISYSLMVTEGFGSLAISDRVLTLLRPLQNSFACINGTTQIRAGAIRPELIVPTDRITNFSDQSNICGLRIGARVRLIRVPFFGMLGEVTELPSKPEKLESGTFARVLRVRLGDGAIVTVPRANAEILY